MPPATFASYPRGAIYRARAEDVYPAIEDGSVSLVISDGPYGMRKAGWDRMDVSALAEWYRPHIAEWGRVCAPSASVYLWGSSESWAAVHPEMLAAGWTFRVLVTWEKPSTPESGSAPKVVRSWPDVTEVCGLYQREGFTSPRGAATHVAYAAGGSEDNWIREWLSAEWQEAGLRHRDADTALGTNGMAGHYFGRSQWTLPTWESYERLARYAAEHGPPRERPYLVHPSVWPGDLRASYDHLRAEYEEMRVPFAWTPGIYNVWRASIVSGSDRLLAPDGAVLHPCQKPLAFYSRMILASSRSGDLVLEPYGGTCRAAVVCCDLPEYEARRFICVEPDEDGRDYLLAVVRDLDERIASRSLDLFSTAWAP